MIRYRTEWNEFPEYAFIAGIDEAGRGPLAGPLLVAAVILDPEIEIMGLNDSKKLSEAKREMLFEEIKEKARAYKIVEISPETIDEMNILAATMHGMTLAAVGLDTEPEFCLIDGNRLPKGFPFPAEPAIKGDGRYASIAAASILAKVTRDRIMKEFHAKYPHYGFDTNKGYPTREHLIAIEQHGICPIHRRSYGPVSQRRIEF